MNGEVSWLDGDANKQSQKPWGLSRSAVTASPPFQPQDGHDETCRLCSLEVDLLDSELSGRHNDNRTYTELSNLI